MDSIAFKKEEIPGPVSDDTGPGSLWRNKSLSSGLQASDGLPKTATA
jgi:hypothetical protein